MKLRKCTSVHEYKHERYDAEMMSNDDVDPEIKTESNHSELMMKIVQRWKGMTFLFVVVSLLTTNSLETNCVCACVCV